MTMEYADRFRRDNKSYFKTAINREQIFMPCVKTLDLRRVCCAGACSMFKTGPITRVLNNLYRDKTILTFTEFVNPSP